MYFHAVFPITQDPQRKFDLRLVHFDVREYSFLARKASPTKVLQLFCMDALYKTPSNRLSHFFANNAVFLCLSETFWPQPVIGEGFAKRVLLNNCIPPPKKLCPKTCNAFSMDHQIYFKYNIKMNNRYEPFRLDAQTADIY